MSESSFPAGAIKLLAEMAIRQSRSTGEPVILSDLVKDMPREHIAFLHYEFLTRSTLHTWNVHTWNGRYGITWIRYERSDLEPWTVEVELVP